jgi:[ribosomal protein S18]-alanine N-acetyltransferase
MYIDLDEVVIRPMTESDLPTVVSINRACFIRPFSEEFCRSFLESPEKMATVAEYSGSVVGFMLYEHKFDFIYLDVLAIEPFFQERKIGKKLVRWLQSQLPHLGRQTLKLHVHSHDLAPLRLYERTDFRLLKEIPEAYPDGATGYLMGYTAGS